MSRAFPVPVYTTTAIGSGWAATQRVLSLTAPSPQSLATTYEVGLGNVNVLVRPETTSDEAPLPGAGQMYGAGWFFRVSDLFPGAQSPDDLVHIEAGTWTFIGRHSRPGGLLTGNVNVDTGHIRISISDDPPQTATHTPPAFVGTGNRGQFTVTTSASEVGQSVVGGAAVTARADQLVHVQIFFDYAVHLVSDTHRIHTNISNGARFTVVPNYTIAYSRDLTDSAAVADQIERAYGGARTIQDDAAVADQIVRRAQFPRIVSDTAPVADSVSREFAGSRALQDQVEVADAISRAFAGARNLNDAAPVADSVARRFDGTRNLQDAAAPVADEIERTYQANSTLEDSAPVADEIQRAYTGSRTIADDAPVDDQIDRRVTYRRTLAEQLSEGGDQQYPDGLLRLRPDGRIESVNANIGALPPGSLRITTVP